MCDRPSPAGLGGDNTRREPNRAWKSFEMTSCALWSQSPEGDRAGLQATLGIGTAHPLPWLGVSSHKTMSCVREALARLPPARPTSAVGAADVWAERRAVIIRDQVQTASEEGETKPNRRRARPERPGAVWWTAGPARTAAGPRAASLVVAPLSPALTGDPPHHARLRSHG